MANRSGNPLFAGSPPLLQRLGALPLRLLAGTVLGLLMLAVVSVSCAAQEKDQPFVRRPMRAIRLPDDSKPPVIDGDLSDAVWQRAAKAETFVDPQTGKPTE